MAPPAAVHAGRTTRVRSTRIRPLPAARNSADTPVCGLGRPGQLHRDARTASPNHTWSNPDDGRPVAYSASTITARAPTTSASPRPAHTRPREGRPDWSRIAAPSPTSQTPVQGIISGQVGWMRVSRSTPVAQPTQTSAAMANTTARAIRRHQATSFTHASGLALSIGCPFLRPRRAPDSVRGSTAGARGHKVIKPWAKNLRSPGRVSPRRGPAAPRRCARPR